MKKFYENGMSLVGGEQAPTQFMKHFVGSHRLKNRWVTLFFILFATVIMSPSGMAQTYEGPIEITEGGIYSGNWESTDSNTPAVWIKTTEPVTIVNSNIRGAGYLIKAWGGILNPAGPVNITVRNTKGYGLTPTLVTIVDPVTGDKDPTPRRFLTADIFSNVIVENCYMEGTAGIYVANEYRGDGTANNTIKIRYNVAKNIDSRIYGDYYRSQFVQFNFRGSLPHAEIAWNQVINEPDNSLVEDNINLINTRGTPSSPIKIHNNYIQGAYPLPASSGPEYSGGGIMSEGDGDDATCTAFVRAEKNQLVNVGNYGLAIAAGNNIHYHENRIVNSSIFDDGTLFNMLSSGMWCKDFYGKNTTYNNTFSNNTIGVMNRQYNNQYPSVRNDFTETIGVTITNTIHLPDPITKQLEYDEFTFWQQKLATNEIELGPRNTGTNPGGPLTGTGTITREYWANVHGSDLSVVPLTTTPTSVTELTSFEAPSNIGDNYGQRVRGYVTAPATGQYIFWIAADDKAALYLSDSEDPEGKVQIASAPDWTYEREWNKYPVQKSAPQQLVAGRRYYIEAVHLEGGGGDHLAVGWEMPDQTQELPIAGIRLSPMGSTAPTPPVTGTITREYWANVHGSDLSVVPLTTTPTSVTELTSFEAPSNIGDNYGQRVRGYVTAPATGQYIFWIAADDKAALYLSDSEDPEGKVQIASAPDWTYEREWNKYPVQKSAPQQLVAGVRYYIEAVHLETGGGDHLAVGWELPDETQELPIPGERLSPFSEVSLNAVATASAKASEPDDLNKDTVFPNPFTDKLVINLWASEKSIEEVAIINQIGQVVYQYKQPKVSGNQLVIDATNLNLKAGLYILKYTDNTGKQQSFKVLKR